MAKRRDAYGELTWLLAREVPAGPFYLQVKLPTDDDEHPWGQWSGYIELMPRSGDVVQAFMTFVSTEAPASALRRGQALELFNGKLQVGSLLLTGVGSDLDTFGLPSDRKQAFLEVEEEK